MIAKMSVYMSDEYYGGLVSPSPPFDFITGLALPIYGLIENK